MHTQISNFTESLKARQLSKNTIRPYVSELTRLAKFLDKHGVLLGDLTQHHLTRYIAGYGFANSTANRQLVILRQFFSWLNHPVADHLHEIKSPRIHRPVPEFLTQAEEKLLRKTLKERIDKRHHKRDQALICLMLDTGLRVAETVGLSAGNVDLSGKRITLVCKGNKQHTKFLSADSRRLLRPFVDGRLPSDPVFESSRHTALSDRQVRRIVSTWCSLAGIEKSVHPHTLRHTFATSLLSRTGNLRLVQVAMGHESPQTTAIYAHVVDEELQTAVEGRL